MSGCVVLPLPLPGGVVAWFVTGSTSSLRNAVSSGAIVKTCGSFRLLGPFARPFDQFSVDESRSGADQGDEVERIDGALAVLT